MPVEQKLTMKQARVMRGFSQKETAIKLGVHRQTLGKWEKDAADMTLGKVMAFANLVGINYEEISFTFKST
ncbi:DNA-binding XRE family transcriptional regulator [Paenibacillus sp. 4624]|uniref:helix-turn-helix transcriptional regulator n=1 Tax=Paenibacillus sp. 4624 TaxID=3156453 RepID=UPI003D258CCC